MVFIVFSPKVSTIQEISDINGIFVIIMVDLVGIDVRIIHIVEF